MTRVALRRGLEGILTMVILAVLVFLLSRSTGNPLDILLPVDASIAQREALANRLGLDQPLPTQLFRYGRDLLQGDLGTSIKYNVPVSELYLQRFPNSLRLLVPAFLIALLVGPTLAVVSTTSKSATIRRFLATFGVLGMSTPTFWLGIVLILIFSVGLGWLPSSRMGGPSHYVLPVACLALFLCAGLMRLVRSSLLEAFGEDYIAFARMKGVSERSVVWQHALRNSLTSGFAFLSVYFAVLISGSIVIEKVFAWPGAGRLLFEGILSRDYPVVQGVILITGFMIVVLNLLFDLAQAVIDPRVRSQ